MSTKKMQAERDQEAWDRIVAIATEHSMIFEAAGGTMQLIHPAVQREHGHGMRARGLFLNQRWSMKECEAAAGRGE